MKRKKEAVIDVGINSFLRDLHKNHITTKVHIDTKINWLLGISGLISSIIIPYILTTTGLVFFGLATYMVSSFIAFMVCLFSLDLPENLLGIKKPESKNYMYPGYFKASSAKEIKKNLSEIKTYEDIIEQYSINIYNLINRNIVPKKRSLNIAKNTLLGGIIIGTLILILNAFI